MLSTNPLSNDIPISAITSAKNNFGDLLAHKESGNAQSTIIAIWCLVKLVAQHRIHFPGTGKETLRHLDADEAWGPEEIDYLEFNRMAKWWSSAEISTTGCRPLSVDFPKQSPNMHRGLWAGRMIVSGSSSWSIVLIILFPSSFIAQLNQASKLRERQV
jgi:hypothetical protein